MKLFLTLIVLFLFIDVNSQLIDSTNYKFDIGNFEGNVFSNQYFGIKLKIDTPWHILNIKELNQRFEERSKLIFESSNSKPVVINGVEILLSLTIDTIETMPHILISTLNLTMFPQIKNENDYLEDYFHQVTKMYQNYNVQISKSKITQEEIGNKSFFSMLITIKSDNFLAYQKRFSIKIKDRLLNLMANYNSDRYLLNCESLLNSIKWE